MSDVADRGANNQGRRRLSSKKSDGRSGSRTAFNLLHAIKPPTAADTSEHRETLGCG
jgi:hypothetical protein